MVKAIRIEKSQYYGSPYAPSVPSLSALLGNSHRHQCWLHFLPSQACWCILVRFGILANQWHVAAARRLWRRDDHILLNSKGELQQEISALSLAWLTC